MLLRKKAGRAGGERPWDSSSQLTVVAHCLGGLLSLNGRQIIPQLQGEQSPPCGFLLTPKVSRPSLHPGFLSSLGPSL